MTKKGTLILWLVVIAILVVGGVVTYLVISKKRGIEASTPYPTLHTGTTQSSPCTMSVTPASQTIDKSNPGKLTVTTSNCMDATLSESSQYIEINPVSFTGLSGGINKPNTATILVIKEPPQSTTTTVTVTARRSKGVDPRDPTTTVTVTVNPPATSTQPSVPSPY